MRRDISAELKELRLHGMAAAWDELTTQEKDLQNSTSQSN